MWKDCETNIDLLDFDYLVNVAKNVILDDSLTPSSIGIYGDWGSGKSSLMDLLQSELSKSSDVLCIKFNGWLFEGYEDAKIALVGTILDEISKRKRLSQKAKDSLKALYENTDFIKLTSKIAKYGIDFFLTGGALTITDIALNTVKNNLVSRVEKTNESEIEEVLKAFKSKEIRKNVKSFHSDFAKLIEQTRIKRLVVFIDELDRCKHETILETFEAIRLFLFAKGTSFVIGADERQIRYAVQMKYPEVEGNQMDIGKEYLEKLIQYPIRIPQLGQKEVQFYIMCLLFENELGKDLTEVMSIISEEKEKNYLEFELTYELIKGKSPELADKLKDTISLSKQISSVLAIGLNGNPRHCKRFLNALELRIQMADFRKIKLDRRILAKIMLVEYFKDAFYKKLAELQANGLGKPQELITIENGEWTKAEILGLWKDDNWIINWLKIEPQLSNEDLRPYFYFSRESLKNTIFVKQQNLSKEAEKVLEDLLSKSDSARIDAIKHAANISEFEASIIHKSLATKIETSTDIEKGIFQSFIEWSISRKELNIDTIACLDIIPASRIKNSFIPLIASFAKTQSEKVKIVEIFTKWKEQNAKLKSAIEGETDILKF